MLGPVLIGGGSTAAGGGGAPGKDGATWRDGSGVPSNGLGRDGDYYFARASFDFYRRDAGAYALIASLRAPRIQPGNVTALASNAAPTAAFRDVGDGTFALDLGIPAGAAGAPGGVPTLQGGNVTALASNSAPTAALRALGGNGYALDLGIPSGVQGATGSAPTLQAGNATGLAAGAAPTVALRSLGGGAYAIDLGIPAGASGDASSYLAPFVGAVQRTLRSKLADVLDARDFGVVADGVTDCSVQLQAAIDAARALPSRLALPGGTIRAAGLTFYSYSAIEGQGRQRTVVKAPDGANKDIFKSQNADTLFGTNNSGGVHHFSLRGFSIDGNYQNQTAGRGIVIYGYAFDISDVEVRMCYGRGIVSEWWDSNAYTDDNSNELMESFLDRVAVQHCRGDGIYWNGPHDAHANDLIIAANNHLRNGTNSGLVLGPKAAGFRGVNVHSWSYFQEYAIIVGALNCAFVNSSVDGFYTGGLLVSADECKFQGVVLQYVGGNVAPYSTCKGIVLGNGVKDYDIDVISYDMKAGHIDFGTSGQGKVRLVGRINAGVLLTGSVGFTGTPNLYADLDIITNSASYAGLVSRPAGVNLAGMWNFQNQVSSWSFGAGLTTRTQVGGVDVETWDVFTKTYAPVKFAVAGDAKQRTIMLKSSNPGNTPYAITADGAAQSATNQVIIADKTTARVIVDIVAQRADVDGDTCSFTIECHLKRGTGVASVVLSGKTVTTKYASTATPTVDAVADTTYGGLRLLCTGVASQTWRFLAMVRTVEVSS